MPVAVAGALATSALSGFAGATLFGGAIVLNGFEVFLSRPVDFILTPIVETLR